MFDCMEALGLGPRQLYDVTSHGACMLRKASPFFAGLDTFAWTGSASVQCKWYPRLFLTHTHTCSRVRAHTLSLPPSSLIAGLLTPQGSAGGLLS